MKREQFRKQTYVRPLITVFKTEAACQLMIGSKASGNAGSGNTGGAGGDAKQGWFDEEDEEEEETAENAPFTPWY